MINTPSAAMQNAMSLASISYTRKTSLDLKRLPELASQPHVGDLVILSEEEGAVIESLTQLVGSYCRKTEWERPLCVAIFGPPGSGKSFAAKQVAQAALEGIGLAMVFTEINLTQVSAPEELADTLTNVALDSAQAPERMPVVLFDEFDAPRDGAPFGWLSWFLAPMNDGTFRRAGEKVTLKRAIYVFAGGTSDSMAEFVRRCEEPALRSAKGPDFLSRLRGFLDMAGLNSGPEREMLLRRAIVLRAVLAKRARQERSAGFQLDPEVVASLLRGVRRYRHGARSIQALGEMLALPNESRRVGWEALPPDHLMRLFVDRGPLDTQRVGGSVALSAFTSEDDESSPQIESCVEVVARALWHEGATLAYAGLPGLSSSRAIIEALVETLRGESPEPARDERHRRQPPPWLRWFVSQDQLRNGRPFGFDGELGNNLALVGVDIVSENFLSVEEQHERDALGDVEARAIERFRRRLTVARASVARFAVGGQPGPGNTRRPSGIVEELALSLALGKPIYLAGGFGGATGELGGVLGLCDRGGGRVPACLAVEAPWLDAIADDLRPPPLRKLPVTPSEQALFLRKHALGSRHWPDNGLSLEDNRRLFASNDAAEVAKLVVQGLKQLQASSTTTAPGSNT